MVKKFKILYGGECYHPEISVNKKGSFKQMTFPALFFFIQLDNGKRILFDTGYSEIFNEATKKMPFWIYKKITKVKLNTKNIKENLLSIGENCEDIDFVFISHFHPDHIGNLKYFEKAKFITSSKAYNLVKKLSGFKALKKGFLKEHIPENFEERVIFYNETYEKTTNLDLGEFENVYRILDDEIYAVELEGHIEGHTGLYFQAGETKVFLIADSVWRGEEFVNKEYLPQIAKLVFSDFEKYKENVNKLNKMKKEIKNILIIPSHCGKIYNEVLKNEEFV